MPNGPEDIRDDKYNSFWCKDVHVKLDKRMDNIDGPDGSLNRLHDRINLMDIRLERRLDNISQDLKVEMKAAREDFKAEMAEQQQIIRDDVAHVRRKYDKLILFLLGILVTTTGTFITVGYTLFRLLHSIGGLDILFPS